MQAELTELETQYEIHLEHPIATGAEHTPLMTMGPTPAMESLPAPPVGIPTALGPAIATPNVPRLATAPMMDPRFITNGEFFAFLERPMTAGGIGIPQQHQRKQHRMQ